MNINVSLREKFGREAQICFQDQSIDLECSEEMREKLRQDLQDVMRVFGGLLISMIEDRLAEVPDRHRIMEDFMNLVESYAVSKTQQHESVREQ
jgi:hypothetical protein